MSTEVLESTDIDNAAALLKAAATRTRMLILMNLETWDSASVWDFCLNSQNLSASTMRSNFNTLCAAGLLKVSVDTPGIEHRQYALTPAGRLAAKLLRLAIAASKEGAVS